jgi:hypothetical protein
MGMMHTTTAAAAVSCSQVSKRINIHAASGMRTALAATVATAASAVSTTASSTVTAAASSAATAATSAVGGLVDTDSTSVEPRNVSDMDR